MSAEGQHAPYDIDIEQALIGSLLVNKNAYFVLSESMSLGPEHFYDPLHSRIWEAMSRLFDGDRAVTPLTLHAEMKSDPGLVEVGGTAYLSGLASASPALPNVRDFARIIRDLAVRRHMIVLGKQIVTAAYEPPAGMSVQKQIDEIDRAFGAVKDNLVDLNQTPILNSADFVAGFASPDYVLDGILQRGFLYSLTAQTGVGKTAILLRLLAHVALGKSMSGREVARGRALMLVGENADDVRARWIALTEQLGIFPGELDVHFMPGVFSIRESFSRIRSQAQSVGGYSLIGVDTSAAYFAGDEENDNKQLGDHARTLRILTQLPGIPCVVSPCHPTKGASEDNLLPRGGGAFIAEVDGNLIAVRRPSFVEMHWQGKFRGPDFEPLAFEMRAVNSDQLIDSKGRHVPSVVAIPINDDERVERDGAANFDLRCLLKTMLENPTMSMSGWAEKAGWHTRDGKPSKSKVQRLLNDLKKQKLATKELEAWVLTAAGERTAGRGSK